MKGKENSDTHPVLKGGWGIKVHFNVPRKKE